MDIRLGVFDVDNLELADTIPRRSLPSGPNSGRRAEFGALSRMTHTTFASEADHQAAMAKWFVVDASKHVLGRMSVRIAEVLMGKHSPLYTPHLSVGVGIIVINASKVGITGDKRSTRTYTRYTGYPGGLKKSSLVSSWIILPKPWSSSRCVACCPRTSWHTVP